MNDLVLLSAHCPGVSEHPASSFAAPVEFLDLPAGSDLCSRVQALSAEQKNATRVVVTLLTDVLGPAQLEQLKEQLPRLSLLANYAVGYNNIDVRAAAQLGLCVSNTPHVLGDATADLTITLMLMVARRVWPGALEIHATGRFPGWSPTYGLGVDLAGRTLGIVGLGDIGRRVAQRARVFGMKVVALDSLRTGKSSAAHSAVDGIERLAEADFLSAVDVLSLHCPLTEQTKRWLNADRLRQLRKGAMVINTARGDVIDEPALAEALNSGHLFGAGLDVFCGEPILSDCLRGADHLIVLPHLGSATLETREAMGRKVLENVAALLKGESPLPSQVPVS